MGTFTSLTDEDIASIAAGFALGGVRSWRAIAAGTINSNFDVTTDQGRWFVRVNEGKTEDDVAWEGELCAHLAARGAPVLVPKPADAAAKRDGADAASGGAEPEGRGPGAAPRATAAIERYLVYHGRLVSVFAWVDGGHRAPHQVTPTDARAVGAALARMHTAGDDFAGARRAGIYTWPHIRARFDSFAASTDPALAQAIAILSAELAELAAHDAIRAAARRGIIHGDLFRDNVLWDDHGLRAILDFEQASVGSLVYDLAVTLNDWAWDVGPRDDIARALCAGYQGIRALDAAERDAFPLEVRAAAVRFTVTRITDVYLARVPNPEKDFRAYLARVIAWRDGRLGPVLAVV